MFGLVQNFFNQSSFSRACSNLEEAVAQLKTPASVAETPPQPANESHDWWKKNGHHLPRSSSLRLTGIRLRLH